MNFDRLRYLMIAGLLAGMVVACLMQPPRGDEARYYRMPLTASAEAWPELQFEHLHHGLSPLWLWMIGGLAQLPGSEIIWGRLLSWGCFGGCLCLLRRSPWAILLLLHPFIVIYACRAHPFMPGLFCFLGALCLPYSRWPVGAALFAGAAHLQGNLAALAPLFGFREQGLPLSERIRRSLWACTAAFAGIIGGWMMVGGMIAPNFYHSGIYQERWLRASHETWPYPLLAMAFTGGLLWLVNFSLRKKQFRLGILRLAVVGAALLAYAPLPWGPMASAVNLTSELKKALWFLIMAGLLAGWLRAIPSPWLLVAGAVSGGVFFSLLPFYFERLAWWVALQAAFLWVLAEEDQMPGLSRERKCLLISAGVLCSVLYFLFGSL